MTTGSAERLAGVLLHSACCDTLGGLQHALDALRTSSGVPPRLRLQGALLLRRYARTLKAEREYAWSCYHAAVASAALQRFALAERLWTIALDVFVRLGDTYGQARVALARGRDAGDQLQVGLALVHYDAALALSRSGRHSALEIKVLGAMSSLAEQIGDREAALHHLERLIDLTDGQAHVVALVNAARLAQELGRTRQAQRLIVRALGALDKVSQPARQLSIRALTMYSRVLLDDGDAQGSLDAALQAHSAAEAGDDALSRAEARLLLGGAAMALGEQAQAQAALNEAERALQPLTASPALIRLRVRLAQAFSTCGVLDPARWQLNAARADTTTLQALPGVAGAFGSQVLLAEVLRAFVEIEEQAQNFVAALALHREYHALDRSNFSQARAAYAQAVSEQYEMEQEAHLTKALQMVNTQLAQAANEDPLTGALNRRAFVHAAEQALAPYHAEPYLGVNRRRVPDDNVALVLFDLDHFKQINDEFGHAAGDAALMQVVKICNRVVRKQDRIARWGGEEFILFLRNTDLGGGLRVCERVREALHAYDWAALHPGMKVTASFGVGSWMPHDLLGEHALMLAVADVDRALYSAKQAGRDRAEVVLPKGRGDFN